MRITKKDALDIAKKISTGFGIYACGPYGYIDLSEDQVAEIIEIAANHQYAQEAIEKYCDKVIGCV